MLIYECFQSKSFVAHLKITRALNLLITRNTVNLCNLMYKSIYKHKVVIEITGSLHRKAVKVLKCST